MLKRSARNVSQVCTGVRSFSSASVQNAPPLPVRDPHASASWRPASFERRQNDRKLNLSMDRFRRPRNEQIGAVAVEKSRLGDKRAAELWLEQSTQKEAVAGGSESEHAYNTLLAAHAQRGEVFAAQRVIGKMSKARIVPGTRAYGALISSCHTAGMQCVGAAELAEKWFYCMKDRGVIANAVHYIGVLGAYAAAGNVSAAHRWFDELMNVFPAVYFDPRPYTSLMRAYAINLDGAGAERVLDDMIKKGVRANIVSYTTVLTAYANSGDVINTYQIVTRMALARCVPDAITVGALLTICQNRTDAFELISIACRHWDVDVPKRLYYRLRSKFGSQMTEQLLDELNIGEKDRKPLWKGHRPATGAVIRNQRKRW
jgi:pentatricopeptide repeat protein